MSDASWFKAWYREYKILFEFFMILMIFGMLVGIAFLAYTPCVWFARPNLKASVESNVVRLYMIGYKYKKDINAPFYVDHCLFFCEKWENQIYNLKPCEGWTFKLKHENRTCHLPGSLCQSIPEQNQPWYWSSGEGQGQFCFMISINRGSHVQCYSKKNIESSQHPQNDLLDLGDTQSALP